MTSLLTALRERALQLSATEFLAYHPGCWIQYYDDTPAKDPGKALSTPLFSPAFAALKQKSHCAVCFSLQAFTGSRSKEGIAAFQNLGVDVDLLTKHERGKFDSAAIDQKKEDYLQHVLQAFPLKPHWLVETGHGFHIIFRVKPRSDPEGIRLGEAITCRLISLLQGDECANLLTQVLRVPGYHQFKDPDHPFLCQLLTDNGKMLEAYDLEQVGGLLAAKEVFSMGKEGGRMQQGGQSSPTKPEQSKWQAGLAGVGEGKRNDTAASLAGKILSELPEELWETAGFGGLKEWNLRNQVSLSEQELRMIYASIVKRERTSRQRETLADPDAATSDTRTRSQADALVALARQEHTLLFSDQFGEPHASVRIGNLQRTWKVKSQEFREWMGKQLWDTKHKACSSEALHAALNTLAGIARYEGPRIPLENRIAWHEGALWYDLCDDKGRAVRVTAEGWDIAPEAPTLFRRYSHQLPQVCPVRGRPLSSLLPFVHLANPRQAPLLLSYLVTCLLPDIPHPLAVFFGAQGAAKSTVTKLLRRLIDPTSLEGLALPETRQLPQLLFHHYFPAFDNVPALSDEESDLLCRAVTGDGFSRRRLYSDDDDVIYHFRRCVCLNGINLAAEKPDLLDRCLLFPLDRISEDERREEHEVLRSFEAMRPELLGAIFDALCGALRGYPSLPALPLPRMADFARWGCAVADALGVGRDSFLSLYGDNIREQQEAAIEANPVASAVTELMTRREEWRGTPTELLVQLQRLMRDSAENGLVAWFPKRPNLLTKQLNVMRTNLAHTGILIDTGYRSNGRRRIVIRKTDNSAPSAERQVTIRDASAPRSPKRPALSIPPAAVTKKDSANADDEVLDGEEEPESGSSLHLPRATS